MFPANQLIGEMDRLGVHFVVGDNLPETVNSLSPAELMAGLVVHNDARIRLSLIPVLLQYPEYSEFVQEALELLDDSQKVIFKLYYTAASLLQLVYCDQIEGLVEDSQVIYDHFSEELGITKEGTAKERLRELAKRHQEITKLPVNWYGTYHHAAKRILTRMQREREWAKV